MVGDLFDPKVNGHASPDDLIRAVQQEANNNSSSFSFDDDDLDLDDTKAALSAKPEKSGSRSSGDGGAAAVTLSSQKMAGLKDLLLAEKLNTSAIQLQLTAQSQRTRRE
ncbi:hypothetical protein MRX96_043297 [Rhipicephalus microplus]